MTQLLTLTPDDLATLARAAAILARILSGLVA